MLYPSLCIAQKEKISLTGYIIVNGSEKIPYKLVLTDSAGSLRGYSLTYNEPDEAKSFVTGKLNRKKKHLSFKETSIAYAHGSHPGDAMCLISASLDYVNNGKANVLSGTLTSVQADKTSCGSGILVFLNKEELEKIFADSKEKADTEIVVGRKRKKDAVLVQEPAGDGTAANGPGRVIGEQTEKRVTVVSGPAEEIRITAGIEKTLDWYTDTVVLDMWDGGTTDGDRISVKMNGEVVLLSHTLSKTKKRLFLPVSRGITTLSIIAENEGNDPPNTATLLLTDGGKKHSILAYNVSGQAAIIRIKR